MGRDGAAGSKPRYWRLVRAGVGGATLSTSYIQRSEQLALSHKEAFLFSIQAYWDSENFEAAVCKVQSQPLVEQAVPFTNTGANNDIELSLWERGKSLGMVTHMSIHKHNDKLELTCLFTKYKGKSH